MPQQLIYTSAPRGVVAGRSGHCTVARSATLREALMLQLEKWSYYQHLSLSGGLERPILCCRVADIRGTRYHVLSRIQDAGLDFTGRTNFVAHHLVFTPEEVRQFAAPPRILRHWPGWVKSWSQDPVLLESEDWRDLATLPAAALPAKAWQQLAGDAIHGYGLLEARTGTAFRVDQLTEEQILALLGESLELLELRDPRRDFRATAWQYTFTTSLQEQDNPADFRWRCLHADNPAAARFAGPDCRELGEIRTTRVTDEEARLARLGRQPPRWIAQPQNARITEGETAKLQAQAEGIPAPGYQWFALDRAGNGQPVPHGTGAELVLPQPLPGVSRYVVRASNSQGETTSAVATLSVEPKLRVASARPASSAPVSRRAAPAYIKSEEEIDRQRRRIAGEKAEQQLRRSRRLKKILAVCCIVVALLALGFVGVMKHRQNSPKAASNSIVSSNPVANASPDGQPPETPPAGNNPQGTNRIQALDGYQLPDGWMPVGIGNIQEPSAQYASSNFYLSGSAEGFADKGDNVLFVCKTNLAKELQAELLTNEPSLARGVRGLMARESEKSNAAFLFIGTSANQIIARNRDTSGKFGSTNFFIQKTNQTKPVFFKIQSEQEQIVPFFSFDAIHWESGALSNQMSTNTPILIGFAMASGSSSNKISAKFKNLSE